MIPANYNIPFKDERCVNYCTFFYYYCKITQVYMSTVYDLRISREPFYGN